MKSKTTAAVLALLLGGLGVHKFYLGQPIWGLLYLFFCWTFVPAIIAFVEFFILLLMSEESFNARFNRSLLAHAPAQNIVVNVANTATAGPAVDVTSRLKALHDLKVSGALSEDEFATEKRKLLAG